MPEVEFKEIEEPEFEKAEFEKAEFDLDTAMETPGFFEFLNKNAGEDVESLAKPEVEKFYESFVAANATREFYKEVIQKDLGVQFEDEDPENKELQMTLETHFVNNQHIPKYAEDMLENMREFKELPQRIAEKEKTFIELGGKERAAAEEQALAEERSKLGTLGIELGRMEQKREISKSMHGIRGFFNYKNSELIGWMFRNKEESEARKKTVNEWRKEIANLSQTIEESHQKATRSQTKVEILNQLEKTSVDLKDKMDALKTLFLTEYGEPAVKIIAIAQAKLRERLQDIFDHKKRNIKELESGLELVQKLGQTEIKYLEKSELGEFAQKFDSLIEQKTDRNILNKLKKLTLGASGPIKDLQNNLKKFFATEKLGTKDREAAQQFIRSRLEAYVKLSESPKGETPESFRAKKLAVKCLLLKLHG